MGRQVDVGGSTEESGTKRGMGQKNKARHREGRKNVTCRWFTLVHKQLVAYLRRAAARSTLCRLHTPTYSLT